MKQKAAVVIPVYKAELEHAEKASLMQVLNVLGNYPFVLVHPTSLSLTSYRELIDGCGNRLNVEFRSFHDRFFHSIKGYNKMMMSPQFYSSFIDFKFILIYQLDCWVFRDELGFWCDQNYDYIGAPWFEGWINISDDAKFIGVGNGGFSLRKVRSHLQVLRSFGYVNAPGLFLKDFKENLSIPSFLKMIRSLTIGNNFFFLFNDYPLNEDGFWGGKVRKKFKWFKYPEMHTALRFSFETKPKKLYELNNSQLPFGCHKWQEYDPAFWKSFIRVN